MRKTLTASAALVLAALALPAVAAPAASPDKPAAAMEHRQRWSPEQRAQRVEAHIAKLHQELAITAAQEPQWKVFAQVMRDNAARMAREFETRGERLATMSAAANMQSYADMAVQHAQDIQRLAVAFQSVYDMLSPSQKQAADTLFRARGQGRHHGPAKP